MLLEYRVREIRRPMPRRGAKTDGRRRRPRRLLANAATSSRGGSAAIRSHATFMIISIWVSLPVVPRLLIAAGPARPVHPLIISFEPALLILRRLIH
jgi:hypothetical protein